MDGHATTEDEGETASGHRSRLRKRLLDAGPQGFHDYELIEYLLALTIPRVDTKPLAKRLLHDFGGIGPLLSAGADNLRREGITDPTIAALKIAEATALRLLESRIERQPVLSSWDALGDYLHAAMAHRRVEEVRILFLNAKNVLIANEALWKGSVDEASVHVREVIARAIALGATCLAYGLHLNLAQLVFINSSAAILSSVIPSPGGIGPAEAALAAGLIAMGVDESTAFAVAITQRLCTFYLPPIWGYLSLRWLGRHGYV